MPRAPRRAAAPELTEELLSLFCPVINPVEERFIPKRAVLRFQNPVAFIGENQQFGRDLAHLEGRIEFERLRIRNAEVQLAVDDQRGRLELLRKMAWGPSVVDLGAVPRHA